MSSLLQRYGLDCLSVDERLALVHDLWDSISADLEKRPLSDREKQVVDARLASHDANPSAAIPWEEIEAQLVAKLRK